MAGRLKARRAAALAALAVLLTAAHVELADRVLEAAAGWGDAAPGVRRIEVAFVQELKPAVPPTVAPAPARPKARPPAPAAAAAPPPAASAPEEPPPPLPPPLPEPAAPAVAEAAPPPAPEPAPPASPAVAEAAAPAASAASAPPAFEWPPSTRLSYTLTGNYRGPVEGQARVEWVKSGERYQVRLDVEVGPPFAPLLARRITSDGIVGEGGLEPRRYEEETKVAFRSPRRLAITLDPDRVRLPSGAELVRPPGVQDTASQFVQLTWLFTTRPSLLEPGQSIALPLALPRYVDTWTYDVVARETLATPFGAVETVHVKPRREPRPGVDLTAELWVAPALQYLPVRIVIRQDAETQVDLLVRELPKQATR